MNPDTRKNYPRVKDWRSRNPEKLEKQAQRVILRKILFVRAAKNKPCADCGIQYPYYIMQFDHIPEKGEKKFTLCAGRLGSWGFEAIKDEIAKCEVVCANCHATRTHSRKHGTLTL